MAALGPGYQAVGASEMARLAKDACDVPGGVPNTTATCSVSAEQNDCRYVGPCTHPTPATHMHMHMHMHVHRHVLFPLALAHPVSKYSLSSTLFGVFDDSLIALAALRAR